MSVADLDLIKERIAPTLKDAPPVIQGQINARFRDRKKMLAKGK